MTLTCAMIIKIKKSGASKFSQINCELTHKAATRRTTLLQIKVIRSSKALALTFQNKICLKKNKHTKIVRQQKSDKLIIVHQKVCVNT